MPMYTLPSDTAASIEATGILARDERVVPHVIQIKAKTRNLGFQYTATAADAGKTKLLIGFLPAGRNRVFLEQSSVSGNIAVSAAVTMGPYLTNDPTPITVPVHAITEVVGGTAGDVTFLEGLNYPEGAQVAGDKEKSLPGWGLKYGAAEDIPVFLTTPALAAGNQVWGNIVYGQE